MFDKLDLGDLICFEIFSVEAVYIILLPIIDFHHNTIPIVQLTQATKHIVGFDKILYVGNNIDRLLYV